MTSDTKILVVYFSRTGEQYTVGVIDEGNTAIVAKMIAEKNGLLAESRYELGDDGEVNIYYKCEGEGLDAVTTYLGNYPDA